MAETDERPSKIRKLDLIPDGNGQEDEVAFSGYEEGKDEEYLDYDILHVEPFEELDAASADEEQTENASVVVPSQPTSKNQLKKLKRKQAWEDGREYRKAKRRQQNKQKKARRAEERITKLGEGILKSEATAAPPTTHARAVQLPITLVIDCDFDELMMEKEIISLGTQITRSYSDNKIAPFRAHFVISSFGGHLRERFETVLSNNHLGWKGARFTDKDFVEAAHEAHLEMQSDGCGKLLGAFAKKPDDMFEKSEVTHPEIETIINTSELSPEQSKSAADELTSSKGIQSDVFNASPNAVSKPTMIKETREKSEPAIVYLTSDSPHTLDRLEPNTSYIIGGLVDKNRYKGICYKRACERNVPTAKLPIGEYMKMQTRTVLATNHVVEIMIRWLEEGDWGKAFLKAIPKRKEAKLKAHANTLNEKECESGDEQGQQEEL